MRATSSLALFLVGLELFLFAHHKTLAILANVLIGIVTVLYVIASATNLIDETSPYYTPLTPILGRLFYIPFSTGHCILAYLYLLFQAARIRIFDGLLNRGRGQVVNPMRMLRHLAHPVRTTRAALRAWGRPSRPLSTRRSANRHPGEIKSEMSWKNKHRPRVLNG